MVLCCSKQWVVLKGSQEVSQFSHSRLLRVSSYVHNQGHLIHNTNKVDRAKLWLGFHLELVYLLSI